MDAGLRAGELTVAGAEASGPLFSASLTGTVADLFAQPLLDLHLDVGTVLDKVRETVGMVPDLSGKVVARLKITGPWDNPVVDAAVDGIGSVHE